MPWGPDRNGSPRPLDGDHDKLEAPSIGETADGNVGSILPENSQFFKKSRKL